MGSVRNEDGPATGARPATGATPAATPLVSVVVPVWNVEPYLRECLDSVVGQTIGLDRIELIAVDDGSTDTGGPILNEYARKHSQVRVFHESNSGGPGRPRNVGLDHAIGRYVFFLDGDDFLGTEALERLVAMAERNASDIVAGRIVPVGDRAVRRDAGLFTENAEQADIERVARSGNVQKLFRRSLIERLGARFIEGLPLGEDGEFVGRLYLDAGRVSIVSDYDCYFLRGRPDSQTRRLSRADDGVAYVEQLDAQMRAVAARRKPGADRDALMLRPLRRLASIYGGRWRALAPDERRRVFDAAGQVVREWQTPWLRRALPAWARLRCHCLADGLFSELEDIVAAPSAAAFADPIVERGRIFARYPHFRDASGIPDDCFDITREVAIEQRVERATATGTTVELAGTAYLVYLGGATAVELRRWPLGPRWPVGTSAAATPNLRDDSAAYPNAGYRATFDLRTVAGGRPLPSGAWRIVLTVRASRVRRTAPLRIAQRERHAWAHREAGQGLGTFVLTRGGELRIRVGRPGPMTPLLERVEGPIARVAQLAGRVVDAWRRGTLGPGVRRRLRRLVR
jgi:poly(ribitol-phosphate) beta-N-acetylglucosaminyltransferase